MMQNRSISKSRKTNQNINHGKQSLSYDQNGDLAYYANEINGMEYENGEGYSEDNGEENKNSEEDNSFTDYEDNDISIKYEAKQTDPTALYFNCLKSSIIPELLDLKILYNPATILQNHNITDKYNPYMPKDVRLKVLEKIKKTLLNERQFTKYNDSTTQFNQKSQLIQKKSKQKKKYKHFIAKLRIKSSKIEFQKSLRVELIVVDLLQEKPEAIVYPLSYDFGTIAPSPHIIQEYSTGRYFVYDNNNKILCFSQKPQKNSDRDDKSRPLIEMFLEDENPRINPTLFIKEFDTFSCLMVVGGYRKSQHKKNISTIFPIDSIKIFRLEKKMVSTNYVLEVKFSQKRMNPIIVKHKEYTRIDDEIDEGQEQYNSLLIFIGGNNLSECKKMNKTTTTQTLVNANETCEVLNCNMLYDYMLRAERGGIREVYKIQQTIRLKYKESFEQVSSIRDNMLKGCVITQKLLKQQEPRRFLFCDKKSQVLEIKYINVKEKLITLLDGEFLLSSNTTIFPSMARNINDKLYYISESERKVKTIDLSSQSKDLNGTQIGRMNMAANRTILQVNEPSTPQEHKGGICSIF